MSIKAMNLVWEHSTQKGSGLILMLAIADFANDEMVAFPSVDRLAFKTRMSRRNVQTLTRKICEQGELVVEEAKGPFGCNLYRITTGGGANFAPVQTPGSGLHPIRKERSESEDDRAGQIYDAYPKKIARPQSIHAIKEALKKMPFQDLMNATTHLAELWEGADISFCPRATVWFREERYMDDPATWGPRERKSPAPPKGQGEGGEAGPLKF